MLLLATSKWKVKGMTMARLTATVALYAVLALALLQPESSANVLWFSGCDSISGWTLAPLQLAVVTTNVHTAPGALAWDSSSDRQYSTWADTTAGSQLALRFWFYDSNIMTFGGSAPSVELRMADRSSTNAAGFCLNNFVGSAVSKYQFRCLGNAGGTGYHNGTTNRTSGWHRVEMYYPGGTNPYTWTVDGTTHYTRTPSAGLSFGSVTLGLGSGINPCLPIFIVDTMAVMDAPRRLTFNTAPSGGSIAVSLTTPSGLQTGSLAIGQTQGYYDASEQLTLVAPSIDGCTFSSWTSDCGGTFGSPGSATTTFAGATDDGTITANYTGGCAPPADAIPILKVSHIWQLANGPALYRLAGKTVSAVWTDGFWIEEPERAAGVRVALAAGSCTIGPAIVPGSSVDIYGTLSTGDERLLNATVVVNNGPAAAIEPVTTTAKYIGGRGVNADTPAAANGKGIYGVGILVRIAGALTWSGSDWYLDDGSGLLDGAIRGIKILSLTTPTPGNKVITGVVGIQGGKPVIRATDIR